MGTNTTPQFYYKMKQNVIKWMSLLLFVAATQLAFGQKVPKADKSPADISYLRAGGETIAKVVYGRPSMNGREILANW